MAELGIACRCRRCASLCIATMLLAVNSVRAEREVLWQHGFGAAKVGAVRKGAEIVEDATAAAGKALRLTYAADARKQPVAGTKGLVLAGRGLINVSLRGEQLREIANDLRFTATFRHEETGKRYLADAIVCGARIKSGSYRVLPIPFEVGTEPLPYRLDLVGEWPEHAGERQPVVWVTEIELVAHGNRRPYISGTWKNRAMVRPKSRVEARITAVNPTGEAFVGSLSVEDRYGISGHRQAGAARVTCEPGARTDVALSWRAGLERAGHTFVAVLRDRAGKELDRGERDYGVEIDGRCLQFGTKDVEQGWRPNLGGMLYVAPASHTQSRNIIETWRQGRSGRQEFFSWSWCDLARFVPPEDPYLGNQGQWWLSLREYKDQIALGNDTGVHIVSYILGHALGIAGYELLQKHPDWFVYDRNGEVAGYDMGTRAHYERRHEFGYKQHKKHCLWATFDATHPEARRWIADQIITLGTAMGFKGARWDVWNMGVSTGSFRIDGRPQAATPEEADRLTAESMRAVKSMVARELPDFTWGYNYAAPEENERVPLTLAEKCRGRGWMLDEVAINYSNKTSPFHTWDAYSKRMVEWGDRIRKLDGIYNPWPFHRGYTNETKSVDWLYMTVFHLLSGGRTWAGGFYKNTSALAGDMSLLAFRFSNTYAGWDLSLQPETQTRIRVAAPESVWWKGYVFTNRSLDGHAQDIVHLVNSPLIMEAESNPDSRLRPPVGPVTVRCAGRGGRPPRACWLLAAESSTPDVEPAVQAIRLDMTPEGRGVSVSVPSLLYFKTVVFEYEGRD